MQHLVAGASPDCQLPLTTGTCHARVSMFAFDSSVGQCVNFQYSGCGGNGNRFVTRRQCEDACLDDKDKVKTGIRRRSRDCDALQV